MPMRSARFPFADAFIDAIAQSEGVYVLWDGDTVLFYGIADEPGGLRESLWRHKQGWGPGGTGRASHFQVEPASPVMTLRERRDELLREHLLPTGSYPRCNLPEGLRAFPRAPLRIVAAR
jgi:hypothetical protein